jgi:hypothetical protein
MRRRHSPAETALLRRLQRFDAWKMMGYKRIIRRKVKPMDCGKPRCGVCHSHKRFGHEDTIQERKADLSLREQLKDEAGRDDVIRSTRDL